MLDFEELETPSLLVDLDRMEENLGRAAEYAGRHGIALRPHVKTHKSPLLAREQLARGAVGLTCATPFEAEVMSEVCDDLLVMYPPVGAQRANRLARIAERVQLTIALDSAIAAEALSRAAAEVARRVRVLVELDAGMHRVGVQSAQDAVSLARVVADLPALEFTGLAFYPGHARGRAAENGPKIAAISEQLAAAGAAFARAGIPIATVSAGSTPTLRSTHEMAGVTEMRPGTYIFNDGATAAIGACEWEECALTVLATVVSTSVPQQAVIDAGSKALGREPITHESGEVFGLLQERPEVSVKSMSEEHGILDLTRSRWRPRVGERVQIVPTHVCVVVHLADAVFGARDGAVVSSWPVAARGRGQPVLADLGVVDQEVVHSRSASR